VVADKSTLKLNETPKILKIIGDNNLSFKIANQPSRSLKSLVTALHDLSDKRAATVRKSVSDYGQGQGLVLESSQIRSQGAGATEPVHGQPKTPEQSTANRRVEFRIVKVPADKVEADEFGF
jgi:hypothetical protein